MYWKTLKLPPKAEKGMEVGFLYQLEKLENGEGFFRTYGQVTCVAPEEFIDWDSVAE